MFIIFGTEMRKIKIAQSNFAITDHGQISCRSDSLTCYRRSIGFIFDALVQSGCPDCMSSNSGENALKFISWLLAGESFALQHLSLGTVLSCFAC